MLCEGSGIERVLGNGNENTGGRGGDEHVNEEGDAFGGTSCEVNILRIGRESVAFCTRKKVRK